MINALRTGAPLPSWSLALVIPGILAVPGLGIAIGIGLQAIA